MICPTGIEPDRKLPVLQLNYTRPVAKFRKISDTVTRMTPFRDQNTKQNANLGAPVKILIADDSVTMHRAVAVGLKGTRYQLLSCDNGEEALKLCLVEKPQVVLADSEMPGLSGGELIIAIKKNPALAQIRTVLLLSHFEGQGDMALSRIPADARIHKPFEARALISLLDKLIASTQMVQEPRFKQSSDPTLVSQEPEVAQRLTEETFKQVEERTREIERTLSQEGGIREWTQESQITDEPQISTEAPVDLWGLGENISAADKDELENDLPVSEYSLDAPLLTNNDSENFEIIRGQEPQLNYEDSESNELNDSENIYSVEKIGSESLELNAESESHFPRPPLPGSELSLKYEAPESEHRWDQDFGQFQNAIEEPLMEKAQYLAGQSSGLSEMEIRKIVREEIEDVFRSWLKSELQNQLQRVLSEIDQA
jgi:CheY-like chemotaxis protein